MKELDELNGKSGRASNAMCTLVVLNASMLQLIPAALLGIRSSMGDADPGGIIAPIWIVSLITTLTGVLLVKIMEKFSK